tara:strand:+ start:16962 stop:17633 length:672 start_codon:yes stop_codon:yes gene_type:complete
MWWKEKHPGKITGCVNFKDRRTNTSLKNFNKDAKMNEGGNMADKVNKGINKESFFNAYYFAFKAHEGQTRIGGERYVNHPYRVALRTESFFPSNEPLVLSAMLHDVLEDTEVGSGWMNDMFGFKVTQYVVYLTKTPPSEGTNRMSRYIKDLQRLKNVIPEIESVKLIDRLDNLKGSEVFDRRFLKVYYAESVLMLNMLTRAESDLRDELRDVLYTMSESYKFN